MITNPDPTPTSYNSLIVQSYGYQSPINFAAAAVKLNGNGEATHAGIVINYNKRLILLHYTGQEVLFQEVPREWYFHKDFIFVDDFLVKSFLVHCIMAHETAHPRYGFVFPDSFYSEREYFSTDNIPEYMTCVGFCLNVVQGYLLPESYINYDGWDINSITNQQEWVIEFLEKFRVHNPEFSDDDIKKYLKRVAPDEYLAASFIPKSPIEKKDIDAIIVDVKSELKSRMPQTTS